jgi:hypothetical protein
MKRYIFSVFVFSIATIASGSGLDILKKRYPWPETKPTASKDLHSFFLNHNQIRTLLKNKHIKLIVELGAWLGASTLFILDCSPDSIVITIDHWKGGSPTVQQNPFYAAKLPTLYETFLVNCWQYKDRLIPMRTTTLLGLDEIYACGLTPDLFYVDAAHDYDSVKADIEKIYQLFPHSMITGDDWAHPPVRAAVTDFASNYNFKVKAEGNFWRLES